MISILYNSVWLNLGNFKDFGHSSHSAKSYTNETHNTLPEDFRLVSDAVKGRRIGYKWLLYQIKVFVQEYWDIFGAQI